MRGLSGVKSTAFAALSPLTPVVAVFPYTFFYSPALAPAGNFVARRRTGVVDMERGLLGVLLPVESGDSK